MALLKKMVRSKKDLINFEIYVSKNIQDHINELIEEMEQLEKEIMENEPPDYIEIRKALSIRGKDDYDRIYKEIFEDIVDIGLQISYEKEKDSNGDRARQDIIDVALNVGDKDELDQIYTEFLTEWEPRDIMILREVRRGGSKPSPISIR